MLPTPSKFTMVAGSAEGETPLNAFDNALLVAGLGNLNLVRVSSILPPGARLVEKVDIPAGSLTPTAYGFMTSDEPGTVVAAAVGVALTRDSYGVIMEYEGLCSREEAEAMIRKMAEEAFRVRGLEMHKLLIKSVSHRVEKIGCAFAGVALWY